MENALVTSLNPIITAITTAIPVANILALIGAVLTAGLAYAVVWFGVRFIVPRLMAALKRGKVRV